MPKAEEQIKGYHRAPDMPEHLRERAQVVETIQVPLLIRLFTWVLFARCGLNLLFALIVGLAPDTVVANYIADHFDYFPRQMPPEAVFFASAAFYGFVGWRWFSRDWRARWFAMASSGTTAIKLMVDVFADHMAGNPTPMSDGRLFAVSMTIAINLLICGYLAFYPGMEQAFKETPWD